MQDLHRTNPLVGIERVQPHELCMVEWLTLAHGPNLTRAHVAALANAYDARAAPVFGGAAEDRDVFRGAFGFGHRSRSLVRSTLGRLDGLGNLSRSALCTDSTRSTSASGVRDTPGDMGSPDLAGVGVVAIGRNEGERLRRCFESLPACVSAVVYVDSGSTDGSVALAQSKGYEVVPLDMSRPFTAARARNAGFRRLMERWPELRYVQFVDGDCALAMGWLALAMARLDGDPGVAAVWGRRRELHPERSVYNRICDVEWSQEPVGDTQVFGGDVMVRVQVVRELEGYDPRIIAGEDPEFAYRMHKRGHRIVHEAADMTLHDAAITRFEQWWTRTKRSGYAYAQVSALHAGEPERFWVGDTRRALVWGLLVPTLIPALALPTFGLAAALWSVYPLRAARIARAARERGLDARDAWFWSLHCVGASFPQAAGVVSYHLERMKGKAPTIIEYKR